MSVIDFHSHILPGIDDGSKNVKTSLKMLSRSKQQGVDIMIATPHFYASNDTINAFLERRAAAYEELKQEMVDKDYPQLLLGAEVAYFRGISRADDIKKLKIEGTNVLLLEMPFAVWSDEVMDEVREMSEDDNYQIVLAHLERYLMISANKKRIKQLMDLPVYVQINAGSFSNWRKKRTILKWFAKRKAHFLGSDCHGIGHRPPNLFEGRNTLEKKWGKGILEYMDMLGREVLELSKKDIAKIRGSEQLWDIVV